MEREGGININKLLRWVESGNKCLAGWILHTSLSVNTCTYHLCSLKECFIEQGVGCSRENLGSWEQNVHTVEEG